MSKTSKKTGTEVVPASSTAVAKTAKVYTLFMPADAIKESKKIRRLTLPPIIKPKQIGKGIAIQGTVLKVIDSPKAEYQSKLLWMQHETGEEFCLPATAVIAGALANDQGVPKEEMDWQKVVGLKLLVVGQGPSSTTDGRELNLYDVAIVED